MSYPVIVQKLSLKHRLGSKEYHIVLIANANGGLIVNRWGKTGTWGQMQTDFHLSDAAKSAFEAKRREKEGRGYHEERITTVVCDDYDAFNKALGPQYMMQIGGDNLNRIVPGISIVGSREVKPRIWDEKAGRYADHTPKTIPEPETTIEEHISRNANWGAF